MGDQVDYYRDIKAAKKAEREDGWANRQAGLDQIKALGFKPVLISEASRHYRIQIPGGRHINFYPSAWRWQESHKANGRRGRLGHSLQQLLDHLASIPKG